MSYASTILSQNPYGYWRQGDTSGTVMADTSTNARNGVYSGSPGLNSTGLLVSDPDPAVSYSVSGNSSVPDDNGLDGLGAITISMLIKPSTIGLASIAARDNQSTGLRSFQYRIDSAGKMSFVKIPGTTVTGTSLSVLAVGNIYHVAVVYNGSDIRHYINGVLDGSPTSCSGSLGTFASLDLTIGRRASGDPFTGIIDEVAVWATALSATDISAQYAAATAGAGVLSTLSGTWGLVS